MKAMKINPELMDQDKYEENHIKECADTLLSAEEIKKDGILMDKIHEYWKNEVSRINSFSDLRDKANSFGSGEKTPKEKRDESINIAIKLLFNKKGKGKQVESEEPEEEEDAEE